MAVTYGFFNAIQQEDGTYDRVYNADQMSEQFEGLISDGVYESVGDAMIVEASSGMQVQVKSGRMMIGSKWLKNDAAELLTINAAHVTLNRYTAVVVRLDLQARTIVITTKDGDNATSPIKPSLEDSQTVKEMCLAYVYVGRGVTEITQADIEDTRADTNVCGWVTGIVQQVNTAELFLQWQTAYEKQMAQMQDWQERRQTQFDDWLTTLTDKLEVKTYIQEYQNTETVTTSGSEASVSINVGIPDYDPESDILFVNMNGIVLVSGIDYEIAGTGARASITMKNGVSGTNVYEFRVLKSKIGQA